MSTITDSEIIKALECCLKTNQAYKCTECRYYNKTANCLRNLMTDTVDLINRHKTENVKLRLKIEELSKVLSDHIKIRVKEIKSESIKEFAERVKEESFECDVSSGYGRLCYEDVVTVNSIDVLAKEMVGEVL